jgi:hypothetical protein
VATNRVGISLVATAELDGVGQVKSALDSTTASVVQFNASVTAGFKQTKSALDEMSKGGIMGMESLRVKQVELQGAVYETRAPVQANRDAFNAGSISSAEYEAANTKLTASMQQASFAFRTGRADLNVLTRETALAREEMTVMSDAMGVKLPGAMGILLARIPSLQSAMSGLFSVSLVAFFAEQAIEWTGKLWDYMETRISGMTPLMQPHRHDRASRTEHSKQRREHARG